MPFEFLDHIATADVAFRAWGGTQEEMFVAAAEATVRVMIENPDTIVPRHVRELRVEDTDLDMLLFQVLQELIFFKDARSLLLRLTRGRIEHQDALYRFVGEARGETIDPDKHHMSVDVKAVTLHRFSVQRTDRGWEATVVLDI
jgi:SHS2 domain-containing protein